MKESITHHQKSRDYVLKNKSNTFYDYSQSVDDGYEN